MTAPYPDQSSLGDYIGQSTPINITGPFPGLGYITSTSSMNTVPNGTSGQHLVMGISGVPEWETETTTFDFVGDTGTTQTVDHGDTVTFSSSNLVKTTSAATNVLDISLDTTGATTGQVVKFDGTNAVWSNDSITGGTPTEIVYIDNAGNGTSDALATRDSVTNETYIGYRTGAGQFTNAFHLGNILGGAISDGAAFQRHDSINDNFTIIGTVDMTPFGGTTNSLVGGYIDLTTGVFATTTLSNIESALDYSNSVTGTDGHIVINSTRISLEHTDNSTYDSRIMIDNTIDLQTDGTGGKNLFRVSDTFIRGGSARFYFYADTIDDTFYVRGRLPITGTPSGSLLFVDFPNAISTLGDYNEQISHIKVVADVANGNAYIDGLANTVPNWTPSTLSDGFTGTGLNDMHYDSTTTYIGTYPNTYTAGIASVNSVYIYLTSITTPGFTVGDTVTDGASTGTIIAGSDGDGFIIIQPIIDTGWTSATSITDISSGAASSVSGLFYTDTMSWSSTAGGSGILIPTSSFISLGDNLSVGFYSPTGHTLGDSWEWTMSKGTVYSKMALFDGVNRTISVGDVVQTVNDVRTDWVLGQGKDTGIYEYLGKAREYVVYNDEGILLLLNYQPDNNFEFNFGIYNPHSGFSPLNSVSDNSAYGFGININDTSAHYTIIGDIQGGGNNTLLRVDDDTETIKFTADGLETDSQDIPITVKVILTQTELSTFGTVPIVVVPAPGVGKAIQPISAYAEYEYGGVAYANFGIPGLTHNPSSGSLPLKSTVSLLDQTANYVRFFKQTDEGYNAGFTIDNQPLYFTDDDGSDPTAGNGTLTLYVTYKIIKL